MYNQKHSKHHFFPHSTVSCICSQLPIPPTSLNLNLFETLSGCFDWFISLWSSAKICNFAYLLFKSALQRVSLLWTRNFSSYKRNQFNVSLNDQINDGKLHFPSELKKTTELKKSSILPLFTCPGCKGSFTSYFYFTLLVIGNCSTVISINLHKIASTGLLMTFSKRAQGMQT